MNGVINAVTVLWLLSAAYERLVETVRAIVLDTNPSDKAKADLDGWTVGKWSFVPAVALAVAANANGVRLVLDPDRFWQEYLSGQYSVASVISCAETGLLITLGSRFWHDVAYGLIDLRKSLFSLPNEARGATADASTRARPKDEPAGAMATRSASVGEVSTGGAGS